MCPINKRSAIEYNISVLIILKSQFTIPSLTTPDRMDETSATFLMCLFLVANKFKKLIKKEIAALSLAQFIDRCRQIKIQIKYP